MLPFELTKDTLYLALSGEPWSVFYEYFNRNWSCYKGFLLYLLGGSAEKTLLKYLFDDGFKQGSQYQDFALSPTFSIA